MCFVDKSSLNTYQNCINHEGEGTSIYTALSKVIFYTELVKMIIEFFFFFSFCLVAYFHLLLLCCYGVFEGWSMGGAHITKLKLFGLLHK